MAKIDEAIGRLKQLKNTMHRDWWNYDYKDSYRFRIIDYENDLEEVIALLVQHEKD